MTLETKGWPKKVSHYKIIKIWYYIVSKPAHEIRFVRRLKVSIQTL